MAEISIEIQWEIKIITPNPLKSGIKFRINTDIFILGCCVYIYRIGKIEVPMTVNKKQQIN